MGIREVYPNLLDLKGWTMKAMRRLTAAVSAVMVACSMGAPLAGAAERIYVSLDKNTVRWGESVNVSVKGLDAKKGYYLLFCENGPDGFPICVKNGKNPKAHLRLNNNVTDSGAFRIKDNGTARAELQITSLDTTMTGPYPNPFRITCALGCRVAVTYDHPTSAQLGSSVVPKVLGQAAITVK